VCGPPQLKLRCVILQHIRVVKHRTVLSCSPQLGHLDVHLTEVVLTDIQRLLRYVWQTGNECTFPVSGNAQSSAYQYSSVHPPLGTGMAAWECIVSNVTAPGESKWLIEVTKTLGIDTNRLLQLTCVSLMDFLENDFCKMDIQVS
jgi:hypothetical protein